MLCPCCHLRRAPLGRFFRLGLEDSTRCFLRFLVQLSNRRHLNPSETRQLHQIHLVVDQCLDQIGATGRFGRRLPVGWFDSNVAIRQSDWSKGGTVGDGLSAKGGRPCSSDCCQWYIWDLMFVNATYIHRLCRSFNGSCIITSHSSIVVAYRLSPSIIASCMLAGTFVCSIQISPAICSTVLARALPSGHIRT